MWKVAMKKKKKTSVKVKVWSATKRVAANAVQSRSLDCFDVIFENDFCCIFTVIDCCVHKTEAGWDEYEDHNNH